MFIAIFPVIVLVIGLLAWALASNPVAKDAGRIAFACGLLAVCIAFGEKLVRLL